LTGLIFLCWNTPVALPIKILVVFMHELSHALVGLATGGSVAEISLSPQQGGHAILLGGNRFLSLSAGYLGSLLLGAMILLLAVRTHADRWIMALCGVVTLLIAALYIRDLFALAFCAGTGAAMLASARYFPHTINDLALRVIGLCSLIYVPFDIFSDTIARSGERSDAYMLAEEFGGPTLFWGGLWLILSLLVIGLCIRNLFAQSSNIHFGQPNEPA
jgi:hypothetical protein